MTNTSATRSRRTSQQGLALILVLILLVVLTLLGTAALRTARIEEQLAGTTYDRLLSMTSADAALADGADYVMLGNGPAPANYNQILGNESRDGWTVLSWRQNSTNWSVGGGSKAIAFGSGGQGSNSTLARVLSNPTYIVDRLPQLSGDPGLQVWRVTARGVGGRATSESYSEIMIAIPGN